MDQLPYDFAPADDLCPSEAALREVFPDMPQFTDVNVESFDAVSPAVDSYDRGVRSWEGLDSRSGVSCTFGWDEPEFGQLRIEFGVWLFSESAAATVYYSDDDFAYDDSRWDLATISYEVDPLDSARAVVSVHAAREHLTMTTVGTIYKSGQSQETTLAAVFDLITPLAQTLRID
jgi:hypothetical protein